MALREASWLEDHLQATVRLVESLVDLPRLKKPVHDVGNINRRPEPWMAMMMAVGPANPFLARQYVTVLS